MNILQRRVKAIIQLHGSIRAAAKKLDVNHVYLYRLGNGEREDPNDELLQKMGLRKVVKFVDARKK